MNWFIPAAVVALGAGGRPDPSQVSVPTKGLSRPILVGDQTRPAVISQMPEVSVDAYPAVRLEYSPPASIGVILNALDGTVIREGVTLWSGRVEVQAQPVDPQVVRNYFDQLQRK